MEKLNEIIAMRVKTCRKEFGMTQEELAEKSNCSVQHISIIENGKRAVSLDTARAFASVFNIDYRYFLEKEPYRNIEEKQKMNSDIKECIDDSFRHLMYFLGSRICSVYSPSECTNIFDDSFVVVENYKEEDITYYRLTYRDYLEARNDILDYAQRRFGKVRKNNPDDLSFLGIEKIGENIAYLDEEVENGINVDIIDFFEKGILKAKEAQNKKN